MGDLFNQNYLWASLIWSSVGFGYWIYGKRQSSWPGMAAGAAMIAASWLIMSALLMSLVSIGLMVVVYWLVKQGY